ncbi:MAG: AmmeMemoRadiSam system protein A [Candidatus Bipolaricaulota bacterium]
MSYRGDSYTKLARAAIEHWVRGEGHIALWNGLPARFTEHRAGVFVSLKKGDQLRGCIGTVLPTQPSLAREIVHNAVQAASCDPRFPPVAPEELQDISISVDVLSAPEPCTEDQLAPDKYGVMVESGPKKGLLLPDLPGVNSAEQQLTIAKQKAGIAPDQPCRLQRFTVERHSEK